MREATTAPLPLRESGKDGDLTLSGAVERVTFHNPDNGFCVLRVRLREKRDLVTVVGHSASVASGEWLEARGQWQHDPKHGSQFRARELAVSAPTTRAGIERYLASGAIRGVGPELAGRLVDAFGDAVFDVIRDEPQRLREVRGVGAVRVAQIVAGWQEQGAVRDILLFLHSHGVGGARALRIHRQYGAAAIDLIRADPYRLARDIRGIGFATADELAAELGVSREAPSRVRAGLSHVLAEARGDGHCALPEDELLAGAGALLGVDEPAVRRALATELRAGALVRDAVAGRACIFLAALHRAEEEAARQLRALGSGALPWPEIDLPAALSWVEERHSIELAKSQRAALQVVLRSKTAVITGGPGVGKTTLVNALLDIVEAKGVTTRLAAPTGRAAKRLSETTGRRASTIHRLLERDPVHGGFKHDEENPLDCELLVVDESSMIDVPLFAALLRALPARAALVLVGDVDQLPSVGPGQVLADCIGSGALAVVRLVEVFRQAAESAIVQSAHAVNRGELPALDAREEGDFFFVEVDDAERAAARLLRVVQERIPSRFGLDPVRDVQVLCPMHRGALGARSLNRALQAVLNPAREGQPRVERFDTVYATGDKVMQVENDYDRDVYNGDLGVVCDIDEEAQELSVDFDGSEKRYRYEDLDALVLAYATTVHKAQGSEYPAVVIALSTQHYPMLQRNLLYTAITRGKRLVVVVGQRKALEIAVRGGGRAPRWSHLRGCLQAPGA